MEKHEFVEEIDNVKMNIALSAIARSASSALNKDPKAVAEQAIEVAEFATKRLIESLGEGIEDIDADDLDLASEVLASCLSGCAISKRSGMDSNAKFAVGVYECLLEGLLPIEAPASETAAE